MIIIIIIVRAPNKGLESSFCLWTAGQMMIKIHNNDNNNYNYYYNHNDTTTTNNDNDDNDDNNDKDDNDDSVKGLRKSIVAFADTGNMPALACVILVPSVFLYMGGRQYARYVNVITYYNELTDDNLSICLN